MSDNSDAKVDNLTDSLEFLASKVRPLKEEITSQKLPKLAPRLKFPKILLIFAFVFVLVFFLQIFTFCCFISFDGFRDFIPFTVFTITLSFIGFIFLCFGYRFGAIIWTCCLPWLLLLTPEIVDIRKEHLSATLRDSMIIFNFVAYTFTLAVIWSSRVREYYAAKRELRERLITLADKS